MVGSPSRRRKTLILNHEWMELVSLGRRSIYEKENSDNKPFGPPGLGVGRWANNPVPEKNTSYRNSNNKSQKQLGSRRVLSSRAHDAGW